MRNIKLLIEYDGTHYAGWQQQKKQVTIQETVKTAIEKIVHEKIFLCGSGRTDAGVHAKNQVANFKTTSLILSSKFPSAINTFLPKDIVINEAEDVVDEFHSRYSAKWKVYQYTLFNSRIRTALNRNFCYSCRFRLDYNIMKEGADILTGIHDFSSFKTGDLEGKNYVRELKRLDIKREGKYLYFTLEANGFLRYMVRRIVGVLLSLGRGKISLRELQGILNAKNPKLGGQTVPANGLCLLEVKY